MGRNAVNGVINIITKSATDTHGVLATAGGGTFERGFGSLRVGGQSESGVSYRAYGMYFDQGPTSAPYGPYTQGPNGVSPPCGPFDAMQLGQGGVRLDWFAGAEKTDKMTLQGDYYNGTAQNAAVDPIFTPPFLQTLTLTQPLQGSNLLGRWTHSVAEDSDFSLQFFYDHLGQWIPAIGASQDTYDLDFTDRFALTERQKIVWGGGYRYTTDVFQNSLAISADPSSLGLNLFSAFIQDEIAIVPDKLAFTAGCKIEHNDFTGFEAQPSLRLLWMIDKKSSAWAAVSRAVRTPDVLDYYMTAIYQPTIIPPGIPIFPYQEPNTNIISETVLAYELGYRVQATDHFSWDLALFYNQYDSIVTYGFISDPTLPPNFIPIQGNNQGGGDTYGFEWSFEWQVSNWWKLRGYYAASGNGVALPPHRLLGVCRASQHQPQ